MSHPTKSKTLLRVKSDHGHHRVTYIELFFDLVFVFAVTQISHFMLANLTLEGVLKTSFLMLAVWWVWMYTSWATNWLDPERPPARVLMFTMMLAGLVLSTSIPQAFDERGLAFAAAYAVMQVGRTLFVWWAVPHTEPILKRNFARIVAWLAVASVFWIAGGMVDGHDRYKLWGAALLIEYVGPMARFWTPGIGASSVDDWKVEGGHMAERCALFIIIALGESLVVTGATFANVPWTAATVTGFVVSFVGSLAMWWIYFDNAVEVGAANISKATDPGRLARLSYTYLHIPMVAGIIVWAVADELVLAHPNGHTDFKAALVILGGPFLFLLGAILFKKSIRGWFQPSHSAGLVALIGSAPLSMWLEPLTFAALVTVVLLIVAAWETLSLRPTTKHEH